MFSQALDAAMPVTTEKETLSSALNAVGVLSHRSELFTHNRC